MSAEQIAMAFAEGMKQALRESQAESRTATEIMAREMARQSAEITQALRTITRETSQGQPCVGFGKARKFPSPH